MIFFITIVSQSINELKEFNHFYHWEDSDLLSIRYDHFNSIINYDQKFKDHNLLSYNKI